MDNSPDNPPQPPSGASPAAKPRRSPWQYVFAVTVAAYTAVFASVIWIGAGFGARSVTPTPAQLVLAYISPTPTTPPTQAPTPTAARPTVPPAPPTPKPPPPTPTPDPNTDVRVPLSASNTGMMQAQRVAILNITDDARSAAASARPIAGFKFVTVEVLIENIGDAPTNVGRWQVHTTTNADFGASNVSGFDESLPATAPIAPRSLIKGVLVFSIPANAKLAWIQYVPNAAFKGALYFDVA